VTNETKRTILCVDDEQDILDSLFDTFMDKYNVKTSTLPKEALDIFDKENISLVISDQRMPEMEGTVLLEKINQKKPICKKILLTGYADKNSAIDAINKGSVDKYFNKPWDSEMLVETVEKLLVDYKTDEFFERIINDAKGMKDTISKTKDSSELFRGFLDSYLSGVCILNRDNEIEYLNQAGLEILQYKDINELKGKNFKDIFLLTDMSQKVFQDKHKNQDQVPEELHVKLNDGSISSFSVSITFFEDKNGIRVNGIVFDK